MDVGFRNEQTHPYQLSSELQQSHLYSNKTENALAQHLGESVLVWSRNLILASHFSVYAKNFIKVNARRVWSFPWSLSYGGNAKDQVTKMF